MLKVIAHDTTMEIPIFNSLYQNNNFEHKKRNIDLTKLNNLNFSKINKNFSFSKCPKSYSK